VNGKNCTFHLMLLGDQVKEDATDRSCSMHGKIKHIKLLLQNLNTRDHLEQYDTQLLAGGLVDHLPLRDFAPHGIILINVCGVRTAFKGFWAFQDNTMMCVL
jgi:hypothetical protein